MGSDVTRSESRSHGERGAGRLEGVGGQVIGEITLQWRYVLSLYPPLSVIVISPLHLSPPSTSIFLPPRFSVAPLTLHFQLLLVFRKLRKGKGGGLDGKT